MQINHIKSMNPTSNKKKSLLDFKPSRSSPLSEDEDTIIIKPSRIRSTLRRPSGNDTKRKLSLTQSPSPLDTEDSECASPKKEDTQPQIRRTSVTPRNSIISVKDDNIIIRKSPRVSIAIDQDSVSPRGSLVVYPKNSPNPQNNTFTEQPTTASIPSSPSSSNLPTAAVSPSSPSSPSSSPSSSISHSRHSLKNLIELEQETLENDTIDSYQLDEYSEKMKKRSFGKIEYSHSNNPAMLHHVHSPFVENQTKIIDLKNLDDEEGLSPTDTPLEDGDETVSNKKRKLKRSIDSNISKELIILNTIPEVANGATETSNATEVETVAADHNTEPVSMSQDKSNTEKETLVEQTRDITSENGDYDESSMEGSTDGDVDEEDPEDSDEDDRYSHSKTIPPELLSRFQNFPLFKNAPRAFFTALGRSLRLLQVYPQQYIVKYGEPAKAMYWILKGTVGVTSTDGEAVYAELAAGSFFGEIGILFNRPRTATVVARTKVLLGVLTKDALSVVLSDFPVIERIIRDEGQERLAMQEKRKRLARQLPRRGTDISPNLTPFVINNSDLTESNISDQQLAQQIQLQHQQFQARQQQQMEQHMQQQHHHQQQQQQQLHVQPQMQIGIPMQQQQQQLPGFQQIPTYGHMQSVYPVQSQRPAPVFSPHFIPDPHAPQFNGHYQGMQMQPPQGPYQYQMNQQPPMFNQPFQNQLMPMQQQQQHQHQQHQQHQQFLQYQQQQQQQQLQFQMQQQQNAITPIPMSNDDGVFKTTNPFTAENTLVKSVLPIIPPMQTQNHLLSDNIDNSISTREFLRSLDLFKTLPLDVFHELALSVEIRHFESMDFVFKKGDYGRDIYFVVIGEVEVFDSKFPHKIFARLGTGKYFGEMAFLSTLSPEHSKKVSSSRSADIRAVVDCEVLIVKSNVLDDICRKYPLVAEDMRATAGDRLRDNNSVSNIVRHDEPKSDDLTPFKSINWQNNNDAELSDPSSLDVNDPLYKAPIPQTQSGSVSSQSSSTFSTTFSNGSSISSVSTNGVAFKSQFNGFQEPNTTQNNNGSNTNNNSTSSQIITHPQMNPPSDSVYRFTNPPRAPFQYTNHAQRLRMNSVSHGRRRSSVLINGPLPDSIFLEIFKYLDLPNLMRISTVCMRWKQLIYLGGDLFKTLDLKPWSRDLDDQGLIQITNFVGNRPQIIDISNCYHITDESFSYLINEIGIRGCIRKLIMKDNWNISAMAIMDLAVPSVGHDLMSIDLSNCRKVKDNVIERLIGLNPNILHNMDSKTNAIGCPKLSEFNLSYCKYLTDKTMAYIAQNASYRLESLNITRCTTITDNGFAFWASSEFPNLKKLILRDCTFLSDNAITSLAGSCPNLQELDLTFCCVLTDNSLAILYLCCKYLKSLNLSFCGSAVSDNSLISVSRLPYLERLSITGCIRVTRQGVDSLLSNSKNLSYLDLSQCPRVNTFQGSPVEPFEKKPGTKHAFLKVSSSERIVKVVL